MPKIGEADQDQLEQMEEDVEKMIGEAEEDLEEMLDDLVVKALKKYL